MEDLRENTKEKKIVQLNSIEKFRCKFDLIQCIFHGHWNTIKKASKISLGIRFPSKIFDGNSIPSEKSMGIKFPSNSLEIPIEGNRILIEISIEIYRWEFNSNRKISMEISMEIWLPSKFSMLFRWYFNDHRKCIEFASKFR